jgi:hypothetical protein
LRFNRDKRGYENTFVVHSERRRGKSRSRILYWFRTPPGVKVGRAALDEDAIRLIEEMNPSLEFDWPRILKGQGAPPTEPRIPVEHRRARPAHAHASRPAVAASVPPDEPAGEFADFKAGLAELSKPPQEQPEQQEPEQEPELEPEQTKAEPSSAAHARLGSEGLTRLRARHAATLQRITERVADPVRREEIRARADRLNPDTWVTDEEVTRGLEDYESVLASLSEVVGRRRKRRRRGSRGPGGGAAAGADAEAGASAAGAPDELEEGGDAADQPEDEAGENGETPEEPGL